MYDKPLHVKPDLGNTPEFLAESGQRTMLVTTVRFKRAIDAVRAGHSHAVPSTQEFLTHLAGQFEKLRLDHAADSFDEAVVESIDAFTPYRNDVVELLLTLALYLDTTETRRITHRFFEQLIHTWIARWTPRPGMQWDADNFRFIVHELFLYAIACLVSQERFEAAAYLMGTEFYVPGQTDNGRDAMVGFEVFRQYTKSLEYRNSRLKLRRLSIRGDLLKERCKGGGIEFRNLMQADFILFLRAELNRSDPYSDWWPETLIWLGRHHAAPFEVFARSKSAAYFERAKVLLGVEARDDIERLLQKFAAGERRVPRWEFESFSPAGLLGFNELGSKP